MIGIKINSKEIYIPQDMSLSLEMNNSLFNTEKIEGDVIFTFDVPADKNDIIFQHARYVYVNGKKNYDAVVTVGGIEIAKGSLMLQKATQRTYSCGVVLNPYPIGFAEALLKDNDYGEMGELGIEQLKKVETQTDADKHNDTLKQVIINSFSRNSPVKFAVFRNEKFYGETDANSNRTINSICLKNNNLYDLDGINPINADTILCPQIQLVYLLKSLLFSAGYTLQGSITTDTNINRIYYQSLQAMDLLGYDLMIFPGSVWWNYIFNNFFLLLWAAGNVFTTEIPLNKHTPNLTNSDFINTFCLLFGCAYYINSNTKTIEISTCKDLKNSNSIDLSTCIIDKETSIEQNENSRYTFQLGAIITEDIDRKKTLPEVPNFNYLKNGNNLNQTNDYYAGNYCGHIIFVLYDNAYYISQYNEDTTQWEWTFYCGNTKTISSKSKDGNHGGTVITPNAKIPAVYSLIFPHIPVAGISNMNNTGISEFDLILNCYIGETENYKGEKYSNLNPVSPVFPLTVDGENSLGETYAMPYINLLGNYEPVTMQFLFPLHVFLEVWNLLKPQNKPVEQQTRWIMIHNIKMLPIQMRFEFVVGKQYIKAEIKMAKMNG